MKGKGSRSSQWQEVSIMLEEDFSVQGSHVVWWLSTVFQDLHPCTVRWMGILEAAAAAEKGIGRLKVD
jgi:hypothetical protein